MSLTPREQEVAALVARGLTAPRIATELGVSERTVEAHIQHAAMRLGGESPPRERLATWFYEAGT